MLAHTKLCSGYSGNKLLISLIYLHWFICG